MKSTAIILPALLAFSLPAAHAATLLSDTFDGVAYDNATWTAGSSGSLGTYTVGSGNLVLDVNQETNSARAALASDAHNFNPFAGALTINLGGLALGGNPGTSFNALYAVVGRLPTDTGGAATGALASTYSAGSAGYGTGGAFGVNLLGFSTFYRLQILDSGASSVTQAQVNLSNAPTDIVWTIDGTTSTWSISITGATFTTVQASGLGTTIDSATSISGTFTNFTETGLTSGEDIVSRLVIGANNGTGVIDGTTATFGDVSITQAAIPEPSTFALLASAFVGGLVVTRRRRAQRA